MTASRHLTPWSATLPPSRSKRLLRSTIHLLSYHFILKRRRTTVACGRATFNIIITSERISRSDKDCPRPRAVQLPFTGANIIAFPEVGGLHHRYERRAA